DAHVANGGNLAERTLEGADEILSIGRRQIRPRLHQHEMTDHLPSVLVVAPFTGRRAVSPGARSARREWLAIRIARLAAPRTIAARWAAARWRFSTPRPLASWCRRL